jgi:hypothetical protein
MDLESGGQLVDSRPGLIGLHQRLDVGLRQRHDRGSTAPESALLITVG